MRKCPGTLPHLTPSLPPLDLGSKCSCVLIFPPLRQCKFVLIAQYAILKENFICFISPLEVDQSIFEHFNFKAFVVVKNNVAEGLPSCGAPFLTPYS